MSDMEIEPQKGQKSLLNYTEEQLFENAKLKYWDVWNSNSISNFYRPTFLIRLHKLPFKNIGKEGSQQSFRRQDLVINICLEDNVILGQPELCEENFSNDEEDKVSNDIILKSDYHSPFVASQHCLISRDAYNDTVRIMDLDGDQGTFVNGRKLTPQIYYFLKNCDIVSLGISHLNPSVELSKGKFWVFKFMEVSPNEENHRKDLISQTFGNAVILSIILSHTNQKKLLELRRVSKFWNQLALPLLRKQTIMSLCINMDVEKYDVKWKAPCLKVFQRKTECFQNLGLHKLYLQNYVDYRYHNEAVLKNGINLIENFFLTCKSQIRKLSIRFLWSTRGPEYQNELKILGVLFKECKNLQEVEINSVDISEILEVGSVTESIKKLTISYEQRNVEKLFKLLPNISELTIYNMNVLKSFLIFATERNNEKFVKQALRYLKVLKIYSGTYLEADIVKSISLIPIKIDEINLQRVDLTPTSVAELSTAISMLCKNLRKLTLNIVYYTTSERSETEMFFPKMETVEFLHIYLSKFTIENRWKFVWDDQSEKLAPNLKTLIIEAHIEAETNAAEGLMREMLNEGGKIHFPKLEYAIVKENGLQGPNNVKFLKNNMV